MVVILIACWIPLHVLWISVDTFQLNVEDSSTLTIAFNAFHIVAVSSTVYNPILYAWLNKNFQRELQAILQCKRTLSGQYTERNGKTKYEPSPLATGNSVSRVDCQDQRPFSPRKNRLTIQDGDGGVWHGPSSEQSKDDISIIQFATLVVPSQTTDDKPKTNA